MLKKVLIVEDNPDNMELCIYVLKDKYELLTAYNGLDGINIIDKNFPDLILLDLSLPDINGLDIAKKVKSDESLKNIPVIALTAHGLESDRDSAFEAGCDEFIEKPFEIKRLMDVVESFLG